MVVMGKWGQLYLNNNKKRKNYVVLKQAITCLIREQIFFEPFLFNRYFIYVLKIIPYKIHPCKFELISPHFYCWEYQDTESPRVVYPWSQGLVTQSWMTSTQWCPSVVSCKGLDPWGRRILEESVLTIHEVGGKSFCLCTSVFPLGKECHSLPYRVSVMRPFCACCEYVWLVLNEVSWLRFRLDTNFSEEAGRQPHRTGRRHSKRKKATEGNRCNWESRPDACLATFPAR